MNALGVLLLETVPEIWFDRKRGKTHVNELLHWKDYKSLTTTALQSKRQESGYWNAMTSTKTYYICSTDHPDLTTTRLYKDKPLKCERLSWPHWWLESRSCDFLCRYYLLNRDTFMQIWHYLSEQSTNQSYVQYRADRVVVFRKEE